MGGSIKSYLINVVSYFPKIRDVMNFTMVSKNCLKIMNELKINPLFEEEHHLCSFLQFFSIDTIQFVDTMTLTTKQILLNAKYIKYPNIDELIDDNNLIPFELEQISSKITHLKLNYCDEYTLNGSSIFVQYSKHFNNLFHLEGDTEMIVKFFDNYLSNTTHINIHVPSTIILTSFKQHGIEITDKFIRMVNHIKSLLTPFKQSTLFIIADVHPTQTKYIQSLDSINYSYQTLTFNGCQYKKNHLSPSEGILNVVGITNYNDINSVIKQSLVISIRLLNIEYTSNITEWVLPSCVSKLTLIKAGKKPKQNSFNDSSESDSDTSDDIEYEQQLLDLNYTFPIDISSIIELNIEGSVNLYLEKDLTHLKQLRIERSRNIIIKNIESLEVLQVFYSEEITLHISSTQLQLMNLRNNISFEIIGNIDSIKQLYQVSCNKMIYPFTSFIGKTIHIEDSKNTEFRKSTNPQSPFDFLSISIQDFNQLIEKVLDYPSETSLKTQLFENECYFKPHMFIPFSNKVVVNGTSITKQKGFDPTSIDLVFSSLFYNSCDDVKSMRIQTDVGVIELPDLIHYIEITVHDACLMAFGLVDGNVYNMEDGNHIGWEDGSIGYHADDGNLFIEDGEGNTYGKAYGINKETNVIGCGHIKHSNLVFFTCNGKKFNSIEWNSECGYAAISIESPITIDVNYGNSPFKFDLVKEIQQFGL
ncbi:B30.2/SPRY domain-containing protein [Entamoeba marina]